MEVEIFIKVGGHEKKWRMNFIENYIKNKMNNNGVTLENNNTLVADNSNRFTKEQVNLFNTNQIGKFINNNTFLNKLDLHLMLNHMNKKHLLLLMLPIK